MNKNLIKVALRQKAIYLPTIGENNSLISTSTSYVIKELKNCGYTCSESLLRSINMLTAEEQGVILEVINEVYGIELNWAPLVKNWIEPTGESIIDHLLTAFAQALFECGVEVKGTTLPCGHIIPDGTFPIERYNGCPFCGTPFELSQTNFTGQGIKLQVLDLWGYTELNEYFNNLLESPVVLDATQMDSLKLLASALPIPEDVDIKIKEIAITMVDYLLAANEKEKARLLLKTPMDLMRYLWYKKTGQVKIIEPKVLIKIAERNNRHICLCADESIKAKADKKKELELHYTRKECWMYADWLNKMHLPINDACETMHSKREMWIRFIRALRLSEYAKKDGFDNLKHLLDVFYRKDYIVQQGEIDKKRIQRNANETLNLLKTRPGLFARSLFSNMLWFGPDSTINAFKEVISQIPSRLLLTLSMYAETYFFAEERVVSVITGAKKQIPAHPLLKYYTEDIRKDMVNQVQNLVLEKMRVRFAEQKAEGKTMYIDPILNTIPLAIGDRTSTIQDASAALMGTRFPIEGNNVRLFMQWGKGLPAQHLDMDLSARIAYDNKVNDCAFHHLVVIGAKHSGDIRFIPDNVGTAEYIELDINQLETNGAKYVSFTCNAYSCGDISPNLVVGWMNSANPMQIDEQTGVAYDSSCVQHQVRISNNNLAKGMLFGVLDVKKHEIIWIEMPFGGQLSLSLDLKIVTNLIERLEAKTKIADMLRIKAEAQGMTIVSDIADADEKYDYMWATNTAAVSGVLLG